MLLLHGLGGSINDWRHPQWRGLHWQHRTPRDRHDNDNFIPPPTGFLLPPSLADMRSDIRCWAGVLRGMGHTVINYSQDGNQETVDVPLRQLESHIIPFIRQQVLQGPLANKRVVVLAHSRGGILVRRYLADHLQDGPDWISKVITVGTPHGATNAPLAKGRIGDMVDALLGNFLPIPEIDFLSPKFLIRYALDRIFDWYDVTPGARQLLPNDPIFNSLSMPVDTPSIDFHTFGGSSVRFSGLFFWRYTLSSYLPGGFPDVRFDWTEEASELPIISPLLDSVPDGLLFEEQVEGRGDSCVTVRSSQLAGASHETLPFNHAEALWDEGLFDRVGQILGTPVRNVTAVGCGAGIIGNDSTHEFHDLARRSANCQINEILRVVLFDTPAEARNSGFDACGWCQPEHRLG
ncbi:hypothetical protein [Pseudarthrobacter sp. BRE9]|uniref:hypothetical protein n=1 Tax=Pseudarthrobacter sp. BRE9 TaxID=2962582 RepID=UPI002881A66D|nr:hypothetical protein [Pseudarthrobacter sp. BRE9]MDT0168444.1 hypothetical protein [Pseudarthrobacter sp. BRE9]